MNSSHRQQICLCILLVALFHLPSMKATALQKPRVVIVGAGIGGASCAHYLKTYLPEVETMILEADSRIGGRVYDAAVDDQVFPIGAYAWNGNHRYIKDLADEMGLDRTDGSFDGNPKFVSPFTYTAWNGSHLIDTTEIENAHEESMEILANGTVDFYIRGEASYDLRGNNTFNTMEEFLSYGDLGLFPTLECQQYFADKGVALELQDLAMATKQNLGHFQGLQSQVFSMYTLMATQIGQGRVVGGMAKLVAALAESSSAEVLLNSTVKSVEKLPNGFNVVYQNEDTQNVYADYVVIAAPFETTGITFKKFDPPISQPAREWYIAYTYILVARALNLNYFRAGNVSEDVPRFIVSVPGKGDGLVFLYKRAVGGVSYYSVTTLRDMKDALDEMFVEPSLRFEHRWEYSHQVLEPHTDGGASYQDMILSPGVYNVGMMSDLADQMEGSVIAARNAALLISNDRLITSAGVVVHQMKWFQLQLILSLSIVLFLI